MFTTHPSRELNDLFSQKPYQGSEPDQADFLFIGLDANYEAGIESSPIFPRIIEYHADGVAFWRKHGIHHPFLLPEYSGDGRFYHRSFARIGFSTAQADAIAFAELLHVPTIGRNNLVPEDLAPHHLKWLNSVILQGAARHIFISYKVARLMRRSLLFTWLPSTPDKSGPLARIIHEPRSMADTLSPTFIVFMNNAG